MLCGCPGGIARASAGELKYHLLLARDLGYLNKAEYDEVYGKVEGVSKMLYRLVQSLGAKATPSKTLIPATGWAKATPNKTLIPDTDTDTGRAHEI